MLYLNSIENAEASPTEKKYAICHEEIPSMLHIPELAPSRGLLAQWESQEISWEEFRELFFEEMRTEYSNGEMSRLKGLQKYCLDNDVTLHSPEPSGEQTYRAILEGIINAIWKSEGRTDRVVNLAQESIEEPHLIEGDPQQTSTITQEEIANLVLQTILPEVTSAKDDEIRLTQENAELRAQINQLEKELNTHTESIKSLEEKVLEKDEELQSLRAKNREKDRENDELERQIAKLHEIKTHPKIKDIAVEATGSDPAFGEYFRALAIDKNLPVDLRKWLEALLKQALSMGSNNRTGLSSLIHEYTNFDVEYSTESGRFDKSDNYLAHVIRTQGNLTVHEDPDASTEIGRAFCCFFAAALLAPKLSKADHTNTEPLKSIKPTPNDAEVHYSYGLAYRKKGDHDRAITEYTKAIALRPNYAGAYRNRGTAYYHKGNYASAIKDYTKAIALRPNYAEVYYDRGTAYYRKGDYNRAIAEYTKAIELRPNYVKAYNNRGHAHQQQGDRVRAQADFDKAEQLEK